MKKKTFSASTIAALGAGAVAIAASSYYFFGPLGKIHRKKAAGWMIKMKGEIIERIEEGGDMSEKIYHSIIDSVLASYISAGKIAAPELRAFADILKSQWKYIVKTLPKHAKKTASKVKKSVKSSARKATK
jgi:hypothetical protein